jgi:hypothetical protein
MEYAEQEHVFLCVRQPRTTTTLSWVDGVLSPAFVTVADASLSQGMCEEYSEIFKGSLYICRTGKDTHIWDGKTCVAYLNWLTGIIRERRIALGVDATAKALLICDKCPSHQSDIFLNLRNRWCEEQNVMILGHDRNSLIKVPGGFGACGGPNDAWHQFFHSLRSKFLP